MNDRYKEDWTETRQRFQQWWEGGLTDRPLMSVVTRREKPVEPLEPEPPFRSAEDRYLAVEALSARHRNHFRSHRYMAEAYPFLSLDIGPGSMATYLGSEPLFAESTVWYRPCVVDWAVHPPLSLREDAYWYRRHREMIARAREAAGEDYLIALPDIIENIDILASLRGSQHMLLDLADCPEEVGARLRQLDALYMPCYDAFYDLVREEDGGCCYTAFSIWGPGKTAKLQCDFNVMISTPPCSGSISSRPWPCNAAKYRTRCSIWTARARSNIWTPSWSSKT